MLADVIHQFATGAQLGDEIVAVVRLDDLEQLNDVVLADHLEQLRFSPKILSDVDIIASLPLVNDFYSNLQTFVSNCMCLW